MSVTYSPRDLYRETVDIHKYLYDNPLPASDKPYLTRIDECLQTIMTDMQAPVEPVQGSACFVIATRLAAVETALFGDTRVVVEDDITVAQCIREAQRMRKRLTTPRCNII